MPVFLTGLGLKNYRGIGATEQLMAPFRAFNIFIGANNAGKSSVLSFISKYLGGLATGGAIQVEPHELHSGAGSVEAFLGTPEKEFYDAAVPALTHAPVRLNILEKLVNRLTINGVVWLARPTGTTSMWSFKEGQLSQATGLLDGNEWEALWRCLTGQYGGGPNDWARQTLEILSRIPKKQFPATRLIPAIREIGPSNSNSALQDYSGKGLIDKLASTQNPSWNKRSDRDVFDRINKFLRQVTGNATAQIEIPSDRQHVLVHMDGKVLPLLALGTGIQEVIMIAAFCTLSNEEIVCVEEPEIHLHPLLQKKLVRYLKEETNNQYFIATHSPSFIDTPGAAIFHVRNEAGQSIITESVLRKEIYAICDDLGHKASELAQSNAVIWVEGPSDRIYLKRWLSQFDQSLIEGIHFSIMFYGGRLLSRLSIDHEDLQDFIDLRALNRNVAILIDSDKKKADDPINDTKKRIVDEFAKDGGVAWVTDGREIENYIEPGLLRQSVKVVYPALYGEALPENKYTHALYFKPSAEAAEKRKDKDAIVTAVDKIAVAKEVVKQPLNLDVYDLRNRLTEIVGMIRKANGL